MLVECTYLCVHLSAFGLFGHLDDLTCAQIPAFSPMFKANARQQKHRIFWKTTVDGGMCFGDYLTALLALATSSRPSLVTRGEPPQNH